MFLKILILTNDIEQLLSAAICQGRLCRDGQMSQSWGHSWLVIAFVEYCTKAHWVVSTIEMHCFTILEFWGQDVNRSGVFWELWRILTTVTQDSGGFLEICDAFIDIASNFYLIQVMPVQMPPALPFSQCTSQIIWLSSIQLNLLEMSKTMLSNTVVCQGSVNWDSSMWFLGRQFNVSQEASEARKDIEPPAFSYLKTWMPKFLLHNDPGDIIHEMLRPQKSTLWFGVGWLFSLYAEARTQEPGHHGDLFNTTILIDLNILKYSKKLKVRRVPKR